MCGIAGFFGLGPLWRDQGAKANLLSMTDAITHRGPDGSGQWVEPDFAIAMGHRRLSIVDLSMAGAQPMTSHDGRYVISFNGEVYNYLDLKKTVEGQNKRDWRGQSDTEVLLEYISCFGLDKLLDVIDGMFGFAVFDKKAKTLTLARDPFGEKPLYYGMVEGSLVFASELKAFMALPAFRPKKDLQSVANFFKYNYIPAPRTIYEGIFKLPAAHSMTVSLSEIEQKKLPEAKPYWSPVKAAMIARQNVFSGSEGDGVTALEGVFKTSLQRRMNSDVPLGVLLSGGIDSSLVTALMQSLSDKPIQSFSIGMDVDGFNEAKFAKSISDHLGTQHTELMLNPSNIRDVIPTIAQKYDEPFADSSQIPTYLVSKMARQHVTVALTGDGADEIFGGYNRYFHGHNLWRKLSVIPQPLRRSMAFALARLPMGAVDGVVSGLSAIMPKEIASGRASEKVQKLARVLMQADETAFHDRLLSPNDSVPSSGDIEAINLVLCLSEALAGLPFAERAMLTDTLNYMVDDVLVKVDRASMAVSLETRTPFLSRDVFDFAWQLPMDHKIKGGQGKRVMRELLYKHVPKALVDRPKSGFNLPLGRWMKTDLRDWTQSKIDGLKQSSDFILDVGEVERRWQEHLKGQRDHEMFLWSVIAYQDWSDAQKPEFVS